MEWEKKASVYVCIGYIGCGMYIYSVYIYIYRQTQGTLNAAKSWKKTMCDLQVIVLTNEWNDMELHHIMSYHIPCPSNHPRFLNSPPSPRPVARPQGRCGVAAGRTTSVPAEGGRTRSATYLGGGWKTNGDRTTACNSMQ